MTDDAWRAAHALLARRAAAAPQALLDTLDAPWPELDVGTPRRLITTGLGSSEAHARFLAQLVDDGGDVPARFVPLGALTAPPRDGARDVLVCFSQGLSPNARLALAHAPAWHRVVVATADERPERCTPVVGYGARLVRFAGAGEYATLVRVLGPLAAYAAALRLAALFGVPVAVDRAALVEALAGAAAAAAGLPADLVDDPLAFLASGAHVALAANVQRKFLEGLFVPLPPVFELLDVAHGPLQQAHSGRQAFVALARCDATEEPALLAHLAAALDPARHRLAVLHATLPGPLAILEHEVATTALLLAAIARRRVDQAQWPGRARDATLYALSEPPITRRLDALTWRDVAALVARGVRTAVVPLGSTEQHGPHLPLGTDTWIAEALADRLCARVGDAFALPPLPLGCASEHLGFPGTVQIAPATLEATLVDVIAALARHGVERVFVFSAHGGNVGTLRDALPRLRAAAAPRVVDACADLDGVTAALHAVARAHGIDAAAAGHHAGEMETSMLLALRPGTVRMAAATPGLRVDATDAQAVFYPDLRANAPDGTVGDPRTADAARGAAYLEAWTAVLVAAYGGAKKA